MFNLKIKRPNGSKAELSYHHKWDAFTAAIALYQDTEDDWGMGYLSATRKYVTAANLAADPFVFFGRGFSIIIEDASNPYIDYLTAGVK